MSSLQLLISELNRKLGQLSSCILSSFIPKLTHRRRRTSVQHQQDDDEFDHYVFYDNHSKFPAHTGKKHDNWNDDVDDLDSDTSNYVITCEVCGNYVELKSLHIDYPHQLNVSGLICDCNEDADAVFCDWDFPFDEDVTNTFEQREMLFEQVATSLNHIKYCEYNDDSDEEEEKKEEYLANSRNILIIGNQG